jgi:hypothetical protein
MSWTLTDTDGNVINTKEQVAINAGALGTDVDLYGNAATIVTLQGDDLGVLSTETGEIITRYVVIEAIYDDVYGNDLEVTDYLKISIENLPYLELTI